MAARYREILVDEYQATNEIQNAIFQAVSKNGQNIFTVGDVKQSIYRFRLADPPLFLGKYNRFKSWQEAADGEERKILLSRNFRSRREILESTNFIFSNILSVEMGEMDYGEDEALHFGAAYYLERMDCQTEFHLISAHQKAGENDKPVKMVTAEARFVAARIRKLLDEGYPVTERAGTLRPCPEESVDWDTTRNLYIEGDNLEVLKLLQTAYYRKVKMIYIDPPYNTGNDFIYPDSFVMDRGVYHGASGYRDAEGKIYFQRKNTFSVMTGI